MYFFVGMELIFGFGCFLPFLGQVQPCNETLLLVSQAGTVQKYDVKCVHTTRVLTVLTCAGGVGFDFMQLNAGVL